MVEIKKIHIIGIGACILAIVINFILFFNKDNMNLFYFISGIAIVLGAIPFIYSLVSESKVEKENNEMFLEFSRNLVEAVKSGTPISKAIINLRNKYYGSLTPHIQKLANQVEVGIPVKEAFEVFSRDVQSKIIERAVVMISEAEKAGGEIEGILGSVVKSVSEIENLKKERMSAVYGLVVQGYIIFFIFIIIMLIMQFKILPMTQDISGGGQGLENLPGLGTIGVAPKTSDITNPMLYLLIIQGLFTGLVIGKLAEGNFKAGIKHSFIMVALSLLIYTGAKVFL